MALAMLLGCLPAGAGAATLRIDGEVYARRTSALMPPAVDTLWQFNITQLAPDGSPVEQGQVVLAFEGNQLTQQLLAKNSQLAEKQRELERMVLDLAERERTERLATAEAEANLDKAERKTSQPREAVAGSSTASWSSRARRPNGNSNWRGSASAWPRCSGARNGGCSNRKSGSCAATSPSCRNGSPRSTSPRRARA